MYIPNTIANAKTRPSFEQAARSALSCIFVFVVGFIFSRWLLTIYDAGDQEHYANFWDAMTRTAEFDWNNAQQRYLGSSDILYSYVIGFATFFIDDRIYFLSFVNAILICGIWVALRHYRAGIVFIIGIFTNYYVFVLLSAAERLKFSYLMLILAFLLRGLVNKTALAAMSAFFHPQAVVQLASAALYVFTSKRAEFADSKIKIVAIGVLAPVAIVALAYLIYISAGDTITAKSDFYGDQSEGIFEVFQWFFIVIIGIIVFKRRLEFLVGMLPMAFFTYLYGNRINIATFAFFCAVALIDKKTRHPLVYGVLAYMSYKSFGFFTTVLRTGQGF